MVFKKKKCLREDGVQLQENKVTDEEEEEGGARHLSLKLSVVSFERRGGRHRFGRGGG